MEEFIRYEVMWPLIVLIELLIDAAISRTHVTSIVNLAKVLFQVETPSIVGVQGEV